MSVKMLYGESKDTTMNNNIIDYPIYQDKYSQEGLIDPKEFVHYAKYPPGIPPQILIAFDTSCLEYFLRKYEVSTTITMHSDLVIHQHRNMGFVRLPGIGGPNLVAAVEEMIALGSQSFITVGTAGGLFKEGVYLCQKALRDEGTSYHYLPAERYVYADSNLMSKLGSSLEKVGIPYTPGTTWTTDAPYRETQIEVKSYADEKVDTVEMECASLFAVAKYRKVAAASALVVGDILAETWTPIFQMESIQSTLQRLVAAGVDCLVEKPQAQDHIPPYKVVVPPFQSHYH
jgi:uridine phosphorylase